MSLKRFDSLVGELKRTLAGLADKRTGDNTQYAMETIGLSAFCVFFTQSPSFLVDGTWYFSSKTENVNCENCLKIEHTNGEVTHYHSAITPVIVGPGKPYAIPLRPEFIVPQDGDTKQDCEIKAGKRWLDKNGAFYNTGNDTILGDDLYAHQPFCHRTLRRGR